jgi:hypothetical protein
MTNAPRLPQGPPKVTQAALRAWIDVRDVIGTITNVAIAALLISVIGDVVQTVLGSDQSSDGSSLAAAFVGLVQAFLLTPYLIAVHRFIVLNDTTNHYRLAVGEPRFQRFFSWSVLLSLTAVSATLAAALLPVPDTARYVVMLGLLIVVVVVALRLLILFPAIAVDAPGATLANAWADTKGRGAIIFLIGLLASLPLMFAALVSYALVLVLVGGRTGTMLEGAVNGLLDFIMITLFVTIASRLYQWLGRRVNGGDAPG